MADGAFVAASSCLGSSSSLSFSITADIAFFTIRFAFLTDGFFTASISSSPSVSSRASADKMSSSRSSSVKMSGANDGDEEETSWGSGAMRFFLFRFRRELVC
jgi:hypothetical protein